MTVMHYLKSYKEQYSEDYKNSAIAYKQRDAMAWLTS